ncbi:MAG: FlgD immunoglobulin-like domain containing protein [Candidatus Eisenbacteria bacterium]
MTHNQDPSVLLQRQVPVAAGGPVSYGDKDGDGLQETEYKFDRAQLSALLPVGPAVPVEAIGEVEDETWFSGSDVIRVLKPRMISSMGLDEWKNDTQQPHIFIGGSRFTLAWDDPDGHPAQWYDLWFSPDGGETWLPAATQVTARTYDWMIYPVETEQGRLELVAMDAAGAMGSWISEPFTVVQGSPTGIGDEDFAIPTAFGMRLLSANPMVQDNAILQLAIPSATPVDVQIFDIRGSLVRRAVSRVLTAGYHRIGWDGRGPNGRPVGSGIYFVRMKAAGKVYTNRVAVVR